MKTKKLNAGIYEMTLASGRKLIAERAEDGTWMLNELTKTGALEYWNHFRTLKAAQEAVAEFGRTNMVTRRNAMSGKEFQEAEDTPYFCSPSSETYWSM
jgi:hypothetical protein